MKKGTIPKEVESASRPARAGLPRRGFGTKAGLPRRSFGTKAGLPRRSFGTKAGFTLVEILLVIMIIAILVGVAMPKLSGRVKSAQIGATRSGIHNIGTCLDLYEVDNGSYPDSLQSLLTQGGELNWNGPYLKDGRVPQDAWGREFQYTKKENAYEVRSSGPDGQFGSSDDITN